MESKITKPFRHCPGEDYEISIFICRGRQKVHYPKCPKCEFRTTTEELPPIPVKKETKQPLPSPTQITTGSIMVNSEPPSAEIYLDGDNIGVTPAIITQLLPGKYKMRIKMDGYDAWDQSVDVKANKETSLRAILQGKYGSIIIDSIPTNAGIFIDGISAGETPETIPNVKPGKYFIEVKLEGYEIWGKEITIGTEKETSITAELTTKYGSISLGSEPTKAKIFLDDIEITTTPASLRSVPHGTHLVEVKMDGYDVWKKRVNVEPGKEKVLTAKLQVKTGSIKVKSEPKNAKIYLDGKYAGTAPETIPSIIPGTHEIKVKMDNYDVWSETINIEAGKESVITAVLQRSTGSLMIESNPENAIISFDGKEIGTTPEIIMSSAKGTHIVEVRLDGYDIWKKEVDIEPGTEKSLTAILQVKTGSLNINSTPPGGTIFLDGIESGITPVNIKDLEPGTLQVEVRMEGYESWTESVEIAGEQEKQLTAVLQRLTGSLKINSEPINAMIIIDGNEAGKTPANITGLESGKHLVEVSMEGYENWSESLEVRSGKEYNITAVLQKLTGSVNIESEPTNATIFIEGKESGNTPATITGLNPGTYMVELKKDKNENWTESVDIKPGKEATLTATLQLKAGSVCIKSEPSSAAVRIDGKEVGTTPLIISDQSPGTYTVKVMLEGFETWSECVDIKPGKDVVVTAVLQTKAGSVNINSNPPNAIVLVEGKDVGMTPLIITDMDPRKHAVEVRMDGYEIWNESVDIEPGKETTITADLQMKAGSININSNPSDAMIHIDGKNAGKTPATITNLIPGMHLVEVKMEGYAEWKKTLNIKKGKEITLNAVLQSNTGTVNIESDPTEAIVLLDCKEIGKTPVSKTGIKIGIHEVEIHKDGYVSWKKEIKIKAAKVNALTAKLVAMTGSININSKPSNAMILIDSKEAGATPKIITDLSLEKHHLEIRMDGYEVWSKNIDIKPGIELSVTAELEMKAGSVSISSEPSNAMIFIDGKKAGSTPETLTGIKPGNHNVEVRKEGFETWVESVDVRGEKENALAARLKEMTGSISIKCNHPEAILYLDGKEVGTTSDTLKSVAVGTHEIEVRMEGYAEWKKALNVKEGKEIGLNATLQSIVGTISLESVPTEAMIFLDGQNVGKTPKILTGIKTGKHEVEVQMDGYDSWLKTIKIKAGREYAFTAELQRRNGSLMVISNPSNAIIYIEGKKSGKTPRTITDLKPGNYTVEVKLDEYQSWSEVIDILPSKEATVKAVLQTKPGSIIINSKPSDAKILLDGTDAGTTPATINDIKTGTHIVELKMEGYEVWSEKIEVKANKESCLTAVLQEITGSISIMSEPANARILVDGNKAGSTPEIIKNLKPGTHQVEVKADGFENWSNSVEVEAEKESTVTAMLQKTTGSVSITSTPLKAKIFLDGEETGITPAILRPIPTGTHEIEIKLSGYEDWKRSIIIKDENETSLNAALQLNIGSINIESYPENAKIRLDGKDVGTTPTRLTDIIVGTHQIEVLADGYITWEKTIKLKAEKEISLTADLKQVSGTIEIQDDNVTKTSETVKPIIHEIPELELEPERVTEKTITPPQKPKPSSREKITKSPSGETIKLRSAYDKISDTEIDLLPFITINEKNNNIFLCHSSINHRYELKPIGDGDVIIDHTTELMWYQSGSSEYFNLKKANKWLKKANKKGYAGFNDWRLPTLEEASSLLELETEDGNFIDPVFDNKQWGTWTGDKSDRGYAWIVTYVNGTISQVQAGTPATFIRPVRSLSK